MKVDRSLIVRHYREEASVTKPDLPFNLRAFTLTNSALGLGDCVILTDITRAAANKGTSVGVFSQSKHFPILFSFNPYYQVEARSPFQVAADLVCRRFNVGNGHFIQRIRRAYDFPLELAPRGTLEVPGINTIPGSAVLHFEAGAHAAWQRTHIHPRAREVYAESLQIIQDFVLERRSMSFAQVGISPPHLEGVEDWTGTPLKDVIRKMASAEYFIGINSGPLHVAAALGLKVIAIVNFPDARKIVLPVIKDVPVVDAEWLYPQSVILHQDADGPIVRRLSSRSLRQAVDGELYPYWSDTYLDLILERNG
ncbi:glycosyltransferase family 9 protein [Mesorhizobium sp. M0408]|uniref:glycosyltransferase family 9 protein n=1 Tax=Mesorhizobium sp. M0408 TaxID=2956942 RepID=UPI003338F622